MFNGSTEVKSGQGSRRHGKAQHSSQALGSWSSKHVLKRKARVIVNQPDSYIIYESIQ
jgi:hypothetical protein